MMHRGSAGDISTCTPLALRGANHHPGRCLSSEVPQTKAHSRGVHELETSPAGRLKRQMTRPPSSACMIIKHIHTWGRGFKNGMARHVTFEPVWLAGQYDGEEAQLACVDEHLVAVLIRVEGEDQPPRSHAWFLEIGFGPCRGEGTLFPTLSSAEAWIRDRVPAGWPATHCKAPPARSALSEQDERLQQESSDWLDPQRSS